MLELPACTTGCLRPSAGFERLAFKAVLSGVVIDLDRIFSGEASAAEMFGGERHGPEHAFQAQIGQRICPNEIAYLFHCVGTGYQLTFARKVYAVKTRETNERLR